jgi:mono/diheme cytochrome c family protein
MGPARVRENHSEGELDTPGRSLELATVKSHDIQEEDLIAANHTYPFTSFLDDGLFSVPTVKPGVKCIASIFLLLLIAYPPVATAQQVPANRSLNETQKLGRRIYQQRCGVCHTAPTIRSGIYGPVLYKGIVEGNEDTIKQFIQNGSMRMPGFKYGLAPSEVDAIIEYLKTVPKPEKSNSPAGNDKGPID